MTAQPGGAPAARKIIARRERLIATAMAKQSPQPGVAYTPEEAATMFLGWTVPALKNAASRRAISHTKIGAHMRFTARNINETLDSGYVPAQPPPPPRAARGKAPSRLPPGSAAGSGVQLRPRPEARRKGRGAS